MNYIDRFGGIIKSITPKFKSHGWDHIYRVKKYCEMGIQNNNEVDAEILLLAALLHDISRIEGDLHDHTRKSSERAKYYLNEIDYPESKIHKIQQIILEHSLDEIYGEVATGKVSVEYAENQIKEKPFSSEEAAMLFDADKIDFLGAAGIYRTISRWIEEGWDITLLPKMYKIMAKVIVDGIHVEAMKKVALPRYELTIDFCNQLEEDLGVCKRMRKQL